MVPRDVALESEADLRDTAALLYENGVAVPFLTCIAGAFMFVMMSHARAHVGALMTGWLGVLLLVAAIRVREIIAYPPRRQRPDWDGRTEIRRFAAGALATAAVWAAFPVLFFHDLDTTERTMMVITLSALSGGSLAILGAVPWLVISFAACLLVPSTILFFMTPGTENVVIGTGGLIFVFFVVSQSALIERRTTAAIRMTRANQQLMADLIATKTALSESLETLEDRISARTADLEREVLERDRYGRELARFAQRDALTGLYNRTTLADQLGSELALASATGAKVSVLFLDLDKFKDVNDMLGHHAGDQVLREVVRRMSNLVPSDAILARWGGDEFVFAQRLTDEGASPLVIGEALRASLSDPIEIEDKPIVVGATIGIAYFPEHGTTADDLIRAADMAMYAAKQEGRDRVRTFEPSLASEVGERHHLEQGLREAIGDGSLRLEFQPIINAENQRWPSFEALLRWDSRDHGPIPPSAFIPLAERTGEIHAIGRWVLEQACVAAASWPGDPAPQVSVNVSVAQIISGKLLDDVADALAVSGLPARRLQLEVTESPSPVITSAPSRRSKRSATWASASRSMISARASPRWATSARCRSTRSKSTRCSSTIWRVTRVQSSRPSSRSRVPSTSPSLPRAWRPNAKPPCSDRWVSPRCKASTSRVRYTRGRCTTRSVT